MATRNLFVYFHGYLQRTAPANSLYMKRLLIPPYRHCSKATTATLLLPELNKNETTILKQRFPKVNTNTGTPLFKRISPKQFCWFVNHDLCLLDRSSCSSYFKILTELCDLLNPALDRTIQLNILDKWHCKPDLLKAYKDFLESNGRLSDMFLSKFMMTYSKTDATDKKAVLLDAYRLIDKPTLCIHYGNMSLGFAYSNDWKMSMELLDQCDTMDTIEGVQSKDLTYIYSELMIVAIEQNLPKEFFSLFERCLTKKDVFPQERVMNYYFTMCGKEKSLFSPIDFLKFLECSKWVPTEVTGTLIFEHFLKHEQEDWVCERGHANLLECSVCHRKLQQNQLTEKEMKTFRELYRTKFMPKFISEEKVKIFEDFIQEHGPFDVFIDGLNLHYHCGKYIEEPEKKIQQCIEFFSDRKVLIIIRRAVTVPRMLQSIRHYDNVNVYIADEWEMDDIYFTYGALLSGSNANIVTNDLLGNVAAVISEVTLFRNWQNQTNIRYTIDGEGELHFMKPLIHSPRITQNRYGWHIPYLVDNEDASRPGNGQCAVFHICLRRRDSENSLFYEG